MRVIAIDPGYDRCGVAILERAAKGEALLFSTCVTTSKEKPFIERLGEAVGAVKRLISAHRPSEMALEKLFFNKNQKTAMMVAEVRGALIELARGNDLPVSEYTPGEIKVAVTGDGRADKRRVARMTQVLLKLDGHKRLDDEYDAMAVGITHLSRRRR